MANQWSLFASTPTRITTQLRYQSFDNPLEDDLESGPQFAETRVPKSCLTIVPKYCKETRHVQVKVISCALRLRVLGERARRGDFSKFHGHVSLLREQHII